mmetsp:Transcript_9589/g.13194  ORF Transcript_9589/g.13194 Transcript_9589/m.13194 type:complete len:109 (-) Transcript_9589:176-502(-)
MGGRRRPPSQIWSFAYKGNHLRSIEDTVEIAINILKYICYIPGHSHIILKLVVWAVVIMTVIGDITNLITRINVFRRTLATASLLRIQNVNLLRKRIDTLFKSSYGSL